MPTARTNGRNWAKIWTETASNCSYECQARGYAVRAESIEFLANPPTSLIQPFNKGGGVGVLAVVVGDADKTENRTSCSRRRSLEPVHGKDFVVRERKIRTDALLRGKFSYSNTSVITSTCLTNKDAMSRMPFGKQAIPTRKREPDLQATQFSALLSI